MYNHLLDLLEGQPTGLTDQSTFLRGDTTEHLEMFNKAATDLETKGVINLKCTLNI